MEEKNVPVAVEKRVQNALKATIEANLERERELTANAGKWAGAAFFSNGVIFSKSGNGTPFSNGIFFSKTGAQTVDPEDLAAIQNLAAFDKVAFTEFTERLLRLKEVKAIGVGKRER
ncbi:hypothetical protein LMG28614_05601 [Paraburkholderia ultramafica]|uniref:Uncharacterized protein n=1 Tax=Paraburkholderia ultramafica TaxID=1544867 RepID=A0A6S7BTT9_9BURK|nr:hypothetical protein [Paraburkholderia ultramafica]CAB3802401.1 hypothetical protein LMG28614_05601 [Paraburkholderia ultramafica]